MGRCLAEGHAVLSADVDREPGYRTSAATEGTRSEVAAPISTAAGQWGVINLEDTAPNAFNEEDAQLLEAVAAVMGGAINAIGLFQSLDRAYLGTAQALSAALTAKDQPTADHSQALIENAVAVGRRLGMDAEQLRMLRYASAFHDIGKIAIPGGILNKPGPLDPDEWAEMKQHTTIGERILEPIEFLEPVRPLVRHAHERWDGGGYPDGLAGEDIPLGARIVFACDAYDAMTTDRPYKPAMSDAEAKAQLEDVRGEPVRPPGGRGAVGGPGTGLRREAERKGPASRSPDRPLPHDPAVVTAVRGGCGDGVVDGARFLTERLRSGWGRRRSAGSRRSWAQRGAAGAAWVVGAASSRRRSAQVSVRTISSVAQVK